MEHQVGSVLSVSPRLSCLELLVAAAAWDAPCHPSSYGPAPTHPYAAASLFPALSPALSVAAPSLCDPAPSLCPGAVLGDHAHVPDQCSDKEEVLQCTALGSFHTGLLATGLPFHSHNKGLHRDHHKQDL